jgi:hypothetical protein
MNRYCLFTILMLLLLTVCVQAQSVKGKVVDATTGSPIPHASIYLNGSSKGTVSDEQGEFILNTAETNIPLVISCVGYQSETITNYSNKTLSVRLSPRAQVLREVVIGGMSREEQMKIFLTEFIGSTNKDCIISNADDINFHYVKKTKTLSADVSQPLIIYNKKLAYKITYFLALFKHSPQDGVHYEGNYYFEEDTLSMKPNAVKKIKKARDEVYFGSRMHFIRALWADDLAYNDFSIYDEKSKQRTFSAMTTEQFFDPKVHAREIYKSVVKNYSDQKYIEPINTVTITYANKYGRYVSYFQLDKTVARTVIDANGYHGSNLVWSGVMGDQRVNVLLPYEFEPFEPITRQPEPDPQVITDPALARLVNRQNVFFKLQIPEKVYVQTDKPNYISGDTIRLKAYLLNADYLTPTNRSGMLYIELDDQDGKAAKRIMLPVTTGLAWGDIALDEKEVPHGSYTLRAYTNWMRNFDEDYIFKKDIYVSPVSGNATLVKASFKQEGNKIETALQFASLDGRLQLLKDMELKVMEGRKNISKDQLNTGIDGTLKVNFDLPLTTDATKSKSPIILQAKDVTKGTVNAATLTIPVVLNRPENTDVQFMPEGGNLVAGIKTKIGFKAIAEDGKGTNISGRILNSKQQEIASFKTTHAGMGSFEFTPKAGEVYTAMVNGISKTYLLPMVNTIGTALNIQQAINDDSLTVTLTASAELASRYEDYYLIGRARGIVCYAQVIRFTDGQAVKKSVSKELFPTGIARFSLHNATNLPLNERQVFIDHRDELQFTVTNQMSNYGIRDSIALVIEVKDKYNRPIQGDFSVAITDDNQVKIDSLGSNLHNNLLLTSDLKGNVEEPAYYFNNSSKQKQAELDDLMLTQGWVGYDWASVFKPKPLAYQPEKEFIVQGKATNVFGKPVAKSKVSLLLNRSLAARDTLTDSLGRFTFTGLFPLDSAVINLQALNKRGKEFNIGLNVEEFKAPEFKKTPLQVPWYFNTDSTLLKNSQAKATQAKALAEYKGEGITLREVVIKDKRIVKDSKNLNGAGEADEILDEDFMHTIKHRTLAELLADKYKTLFEREFRGGRMGSTYRLKNHIINLIIDGVFISRFGLPVEDYMNYLDAEDIKGIEIMNSVKYATAYSSSYPHMVVTVPDRYLPIYLEVTTYSGNGAFYKKTPGIYLYRPLPFTLPTQFYSPKYTVANKTVAMGTDMRSTLYWEPNVLTNAEGKATVSFFTADKPANYTLIIEGITGEGEVGYSRQQIKNISVK